MPPVKSGMKTGELPSVIDCSDGDRIHEIERIVSFLAADQFGDIGEMFHVFFLSFDFMFPLWYIIPQIFEYDNIVSSIIIQDSCKLWNR